MEDLNLYLKDVLTKLTVTALDANDNILKERVFENVPVIRNQVTRYTGSFFGSGGGNSTNDGTNAGVQISFPHQDCCGAGKVAEATGSVLRQAD